MADPLIETCRFVAASAVFGGCLKAQEAFCRAAHDFSWGDNNRSLISVERFRDALDLLREGDADLDADGELETVMDQADALPADVYVDL